MATSQTFTSSKSRHGVDPSVFGPPIWNIVHVTTANGDSTESEMSAVIDSIHKTLKCRYCRNSFGRYIDTHEPRGTYTNLRGTRERWVRWWNHVHNWVNDKTAKETKSYEWTIKTYGPGNFTDWKTFEANVVTVLTIWAEHMPAFPDDDMKSKTFARDGALRTQTRLFMVCIRRLVLSVKGHGGALDALFWKLESLPLHRYALFKDKPKLIAAVKSLSMFARAK
jgi:hypothetical protein